MSKCKTLFFAGTAVLLSSAALGADFEGRNIPLRASGLLAPGKKLSFGAPGKKGVGLCATGFGDELTSPDGLLSWHDTTEGTGIDAGGGADFECKKAATIKEVWVKGFGGTNPEQYNVTFYKNDPADGTNEANDSIVVCAYTGLVGAGGGDYSNLPKLRLTKPCKLKAGKKYWVEVQNTDNASPWYWEATSQLSGTQADWVDRSNYYGDGCTTLDNNEYLSNCLGYTYPDYMLELH